MKIKVTIKNNKDGSYTVNYKLVAANGKYDMVEADIVVDKEAPDIIGVADKEIPWDTVVNKKVALQGVKITDNFSEMTLDDIKVTIKEKEDLYVVTYTAKDDVGNKTTKTVNFTKKDYLRFEGIVDRVVSSNEVVDKDFVMNGVKAYYNADDITDSVEVRLEAVYNKDNYIILVHGYRGNANDMIKCAKKFSKKFNILIPNL